jgi:predicted  nucleic acid-binding Zn-ribbon protein
MGMPMNELEKQESRDNTIALRSEVAALKQQVTGLDDRVSHINTRITEGFDHLNILLQREIAQLKDEQISDLKKGNERLGEDQRRLWDQVHIVQNNEAKNSGSRETLFSAGHALMVLLGGLLTVVATWVVNIVHPLGPHINP